MSAPRRTKWHPPPPTPKILQLPRRISLYRRPVPVPVPAPALFEPRGNLRSLFIEEKGKAEAEMLRSECDFLRMERNVTLRKLEKTQERKKIDGSDILEKKMGKLKARSREAADVEEGHNVWEIREIEPASSSAAAAAANLAKHKQDIINVEMLKRMMEGLSKGMLERIEEYGSIFNYSYSDNNNNSNSVASSSGYSGKNRRRIGRRQDVAEAANPNQVKEAGPLRDRCCCSCSCKQIVGRIAEEVKAESEQWTEMQEMLDQVRVEMEDLKSSRDLWQRRALASELNLRALYSQVTEWKQKARQNVTELQKHALQLEKPSRAASTSQDGFSEDWRPKRLPNIKCQQLQQRSPDCSAMEKAKHVLVYRRLNSTKSKFPGRSPLQEIKNYNDPRQPSLSNLKCSKH